ncbi:MAG: hypothetical protein QM647_00885 [Asticcacaulis sp.]|uniref:hypothetical protein n=1 Tax=Asticcacaulis sp. TaxID=1872648 RepID=UPI0039E28521
MSWLHKLGLLKSKKTADGELALTWNGQGRHFFKSTSEKITAYHEQGLTFDIEPDPRPLDMAKAVLSEVIKLNTNDQWKAARQRFDPAHEPFIPLLQDHGQSLSCVTIIGPDACLLRLGSDYQGGDTILIENGQLTRLTDILAVTTSRNHDWLLVVKADGFHIRRSLQEADMFVLPWPCNAHRLDELHISNHGNRIAFAHDELGIWMGDSTSGIWRKFYPSAAHVEELRTELEDETYEWSASMVHCALSPDGRYLAYGTQDHGHDIEQVDDTFAVMRWASVNPNIDYPHNACFSDDGHFLALNGCHFYNGETLVVKIPESRNFIKADYDPTPRTPVIDYVLRVYASTWLPADATGLDTGAFVLAGLGIMTAVTPEGKVLFSQYFGSSASSIDYCPRTRRLYLGSYSGILHVFDIDRQAAPEETYGYKPRHELYRWIFWKDYLPFRW